VSVHNPTCIYNRLSFSYLGTFLFVNLPQESWEHQITLAKNVNSKVFTILRNLC
jgi:hypothetical protein